jgi:glutathione S-transferase
MLTLFHAPRSRSTRVLQLIYALGAEKDVEIRLTNIARRDGSGGADPANPHPDKKVPLLVDDGVAIRESGAIMVHLTNLFPDAGMAPEVRSPEHGAYLGWMAWYGYVFEPVIMMTVTALDNPVFTSSYRGWAEAQAELEKALDGQDYLMGDKISAADMLVASPFNWMENLIPETGPIRGWVERCRAHPSFQQAMAFDAKAVAAA